MSLFIPLFLLLQVTNVQLDFKQFSGTEGLSQNSVTSFFQDKNGLMWIGTRDGLNVFNGYQITRIRQNFSKQINLADNHIQAITQDSSGDLWIGYSGAGLDRVSFSGKKTIRISGTGNFFDKEQIRILKVLPDGNILAGTDQTGLYLINTQTNAVSPFPDSLTNTRLGRVRAVEVGEKGTFWVGTFGNGLWHFTSDGRVNRVYYAQDHPDSLGGNRIQCMVSDKMGNLLIGTYQNGLFRYNHITGRFRRIGFEGDTNKGQTLSIWALFSDEKGSVWIGTYGAGLWKLPDGFTNAIPVNPVLRSGDSQDLRFILSLAGDRSGNLWVGSETEGFFLTDLNPKKFSRITGFGPGGNQSTPGIMSFTSLPNGDIWAGTYGEGIYVFDENMVWKRAIVPTERGDFRNGFILTMLSDSDIVWTGTSGGLYRFRPSWKLEETITHFYRADGFPEKIDVRDLKKDSDGTLWAGTLGSGLWMKREDDHVFTEPAKLPGPLRKAQIRAIYPDLKKTLWIGTNDGLFRWNSATGETAFFRKEDRDSTSLSESFVRSICRDASGQLWIGTKAGLNMMNEQEGTFRRFTEADGLPNSYVYGMLPDTAGNLWISTNTGLIRFSTTDYGIRAYDVEDGLQATEFNGGAYYKHPDGRFFFGGIRGFNYFLPDAVPGRTFNPEIILTDFSIMNQPVAGIFQAPWLNEVILRPRQNLFSLEFAALDFSRPEKIKYRFYLEGLDEEWSLPSQRRFVTFTNLEPGNYRLLVQASNPESSWSGNILELPIRVIPPFYRTWWFITIVGIGIIIAIYSFGRFREYRLEMKERERIELLRQITVGVLHEIRQPMQIVNGNLEIAHMLTPPENAETKVSLEAASGGMERMKKLMLQLEQLLNDAKFKTKKYTKDQSMIDLSGDDS